LQLIGIDCVNKRCNLQWKHLKDNTNDANNIIILSICIIKHTYYITNSIALCIIVDLNEEK
jgi:hypothetical protein